MAIHHSGIRLALTAFPNTLHSPLLAPTIRDDHAKQKNIIIRNKNAEIMVVKA